MIYKFFEYNTGKFEPIKSFYLKDELNPKVWENSDEINPEIREELLTIANDYFDSLELDTELEDIVLTGSLANFNWSDYSDYDLHLVFDFSKVNKDTELVKKFLDAAGKIWNTHHDIKISGYEVEIYSQDTNEKHMSSGQYSLLNDKWKIKPTRENFTPDEQLIKQKAEKLISDIDDLESDLEEDINHELLMAKLKKVWNKIKDGRRAGLDRDGEYSIENLVFKLLRRNGYIEKIINIKRKSYDKQFK